jgi:hypothetical protein
MIRKIEEVLENFKRVHGDKYDYSLVEYEKAVKKVNIICRNHGIFSITPNSHLNGSGCYQCGREKVESARRLSLNDFILKAEEIHGKFYDYSKVDYKNYLSKINIICPKHGVFTQQARKHLLGNKCKKCVNESNYVNFLEIAQKRYPEFDYSKVIYKGMFNEVTIICKEHGEFNIKPINFLHKNRGCKNCLDKTKSRSETLWLNSLNIPIENRNVYLNLGKQTFCVDAIDKENNIIYEFYGDFFHGNPEIYDENEINPLLKETYGSLYNKTKTKEEILLKHGYKIISIWENDFNKNKKIT